MEKQRVLTTSGSLLLLALAALEPGAAQAQSYIPYKIEDVPADHRSEMGVSAEEAADPREAKAPGAPTAETKVRDDLSALRAATAIVNTAPTGCQLTPDLQAFQGYVGQELGPDGQEFTTLITQIALDFNLIESPTEQERRQYVEKILDVMYKGPKAARFRETLKNQKGSPELDPARAKLRGYLINIVASISGRAHPPRLIENWERNRMSEALQGYPVGGNAKNPRGTRLPGGIGGDRPGPVVLDFRVLARRLKGGVRYTQAYALSEAVERYAEVLERHPGWSFANAEKLLGADVDHGSADIRRFWCAESLVVLANQSAKAMNIPLKIKSNPVAKKLVNDPSAPKVSRERLLNNGTDLDLYLMFEIQRRRSGGYGGHAYGVNVTIDPETMQYKYRRVNFNRNDSEELSVQGFRRQVQTSDLPAARSVAGQIPNI